MAAASDRGVALADIVVATALTALVSATTIPVVAGALESERTRIGAQYLAVALQQTQLDALRRGTFVAIRVTAGPLDTEWQAFADGNGNGVLARDIEEGVDVPLGPPDHLGVHAREVSLRLNQTVPDMGGGGMLAAGADPLRIGRSNLLSFSPTGSATAGTLYVSAPRGPQMAIRITGSHWAHTRAALRYRGQRMAAIVAALAERRQVRRVRAEEAGWQEEAVLRPGLLVRIVNISGSGVLLESPARLRPGRRAELQLTSSAGDVRPLCVGRITRCAVTGISPMVFRGAVHFEHPLTVLATKG